MPAVKNAKIKAIADKVEDILGKMAPIKTFESRDQSLVLNLLPDYTLKALKENKKTMNYLLKEIDGIKTEKLNSYDMLAIEEIEYFVKYLMFPISPLLEDSYLILFDITPYHSPLFFIWEYLGKHDVKNACGVDAHLKLAKDYVRFTGDLRDKIREQVESDIYIFEFAIDSCIDFINTYVTEPIKHPLSLEKGENAASDIQKQTVCSYITEANKNLSEIADILNSDAYRKKAPKNPGYSQYQNGKEFYDFMREFHVGYKMSSEELNELGWKCLEKNNAIQDSIRKKLGFNGTHEEFMEYLKSNERIYPRNPEQLGKIMNDFNNKVSEIMPEYFEKLSSVPCCAKRLNPMYEKNMTFGYFGSEINEKGEPEGVYRYSGYGVDGTKNQITAASLIAHELQPGHHYQESLAAENENLHPLFKRFGNTGYGDGWAEYAANLMNEIGLYDDLDYYGMVEGDKFLCIRLITDTGMNELGYTIDYARKLIREKTYATESMVTTESIRYSACIPAQCLPYKFGKLKFIELRDKYKKAMGSKFDIKKFHSLVLEVGNVPLPLLEKYLEREVHNNA